MDNSITVAEQLHEHILQSRNGLGKFIGFHRREIERCAEAIVRMKAGRVTDAPGRAEGPAE